MVGRAVAWVCTLAWAGGCAGSAAPIAQPPPGSRSPTVRGIRLPTLMTEELHTAEQLCEHARRHHSDKALALVAIKSHVCDFTTRACLKATRDLADTCNTFIASSFALYHSRPYRSSPGGEVLMQEDPAAWEIADEWSNMGPLLVVVDLATCTRAGEVAPVTGGMSGISPRPEMPVLARFEATRDALLQLPIVAARLSAEQRRARFDPACLAQKEPSIMAVWRALEQQAAEEQRHASSPHP